MDSSISLIEHFSVLPDPRIDRAKRHRLLDIIVLAVCAVVGNCETWEEIEEFGNAKEEWFKTFLDLPNGIPSHDTIARVFSMLDPAAFRSCFLGWIAAISVACPENVIAIDGKSLRRSFDRSAGKDAIHMVSAWSCANRIVLGQYKVVDKSNEITAIPELLKLLSLKGCIVTIDAMGCQKQIAAQIIEQGGDYVLALKGNQTGLFDSAKLHFGGASREVLTERTGGCWETVDNDHGRIETRRAWLIRDTSWLAEDAKWPGLRSLGIIESEVVSESRNSLERRYFITSLSGAPAVIAGAVRSHWEIENSLHWCLDMTFHEDSCRIRHGNAAENVAMLRHTALNLLRRTKTKRLSIKTKRLKASWSNDYLLQVLMGPKAE